MEDEMAQATQAIKDRQVAKETALKARSQLKPILTPGARKPGTPRATPKRFGI